MLRRYRTVTIDAFTTERFQGNPCAILPQADGLSPDQMQAIARETNLSETAFVFPSLVADFRVRYFTPRNEIPFAGHPTIATSFMLAESGTIALVEPFTRLELEFNIGVLPVEIEVRNGWPVRMMMTQKTPTFGLQFAPEEVAPCFGLAAEDLREDCLPQVVSTGVPFLIVPVRDLEALKRLETDRSRTVRLIERAGVDAIFLFTLGGFRREADTHARLIDPRGASEDPFTGSASGCMGAYIIHYALKPGPILQLEQGHIIGRPGYGVFEFQGTPQNISSIRLGGAAVKVMEGYVYVTDQPQTIE
ncbi:MAG: PhzF family phenazine biosynthesis protein [bacterium]